MTQHKRDALRHKDSYFPKIRSCLSIAAAISSIISEIVSPVRSRMEYKVAFVSAVIVVVNASFLIGAGLRPAPSR